MEPLLKILKIDARTPVEDIARELRPLRSRGKKIASPNWRKDGIILGYQAVVDAQKSGRTSVTALIEVKITPERGGGFDRLAGRIAKFDRVQSCYLVSGGYDLLVVVERVTRCRKWQGFVAEGGEHHQRAFSPPRLDSN